MDFKTLVEVALFGLSLAMDAFAVSVVDGLRYQNLNKRKSIFIAFLFGFMQALMPLIGYFAIEIVELLVDANSASGAGEILSLCITWISFALLVFIGTKMLIDGIKDLNKPLDLQVKNFSYKEVFIFSVITSIDALACGVTLHSANATGVSISNNFTIWLHVVIIFAITFILSLIGVLLGNKIEKLFNGKISITNIIGGIILVLLAVWVVISHYFSF